MEKIGTHSGSFHLDEAIGTAVLKQLFPAAVILRSREPDVLTTCDALVDVGGEHNPDTNRFDHHQKGFSLRRANGTPFAGAGLVWRSYGTRYVQEVVKCSEARAKAVADSVDEQLIQFADAIDCGVAVPGPVAFSLSSIVNSLNATWLEGPDEDYTRFLQAMELAGLALRNLVMHLAAEQMAVDIVLAAPRMAAGRILVLDTPRIPYDNVVFKHMPDVLFVVYPESAGLKYQVRVVAKTPGTFEAIKDLPAAWAGLRDQELARVTGVPDAIFCHNGRFIAGAASREGALKLAELALED